MLQFQPITLETAARVRQYFAECNYRLCEYSIGVKLMWNDYLHASFAEAAGCLIIRNCIKGQTQFDYPIPGPDGNVDEALRHIERWCTESGTRLILSLVPEDQAVNLLQHMGYSNIQNIGGIAAYRRKVER